jgi:alpha-N-arabinofuranosidase
MYNVHQDAIHLPTECDSPEFTDELDRECPVVDATASRNAEGEINITLTNTSLDQKAEVSVAIPVNGKSNIAAEILTAENAQDHNDFDRPETVRPAEFKDFKIKDGKLIVKMPAMSIISISVEP